MESDIRNKSDTQLEWHLGDIALRTDIYFTQIKQPFVVCQSCF